jgi:thioredoxin reductase (NADPH)
VALVIAAKSLWDTTGGELLERVRQLHLTGDELTDRDDWPLERRPFSLETSMPGVLAAGDVRHASVKRVASAVGEGSIAIQQVQDLFADERLRSGRPTGDAAARRSVPGSPTAGAAGHQRL